jgi:hypothetical protein
MKEFKDVGSIIGTKYQQIGIFLQEYKNIYFRVMQETPLSSTWYHIYDDDKYGVIYTFCNAYFKFNIVSYTKREVRRLFKIKSIIEERDVFEYCCDKYKSYVDDDTLLAIYLDLRERLPKFLKDYVKAKNEAYNSFSEKLKDTQSAFKELKDYLTAVN